jgi:hypothetical protein
VAPASRADARAERGREFLSVITVTVRRRVTRLGTPKLGELRDTLIFEHTCLCTLLVDDVI